MSVVSIIQSFSTKLSENKNIVKSITVGSDKSIKTKYH